MFRPNCKAIYRLIFEQVEFTVDNTFNLPDLIQLIMISIYDLVDWKQYQPHTPPTERSAWRWPCSFSETCSRIITWYNLLKRSYVRRHYIYLYNNFSISTQRVCLTWKFQTVFDRPSPTRFHVSFCHVSTNVISLCCRLAFGVILDYWVPASVYTNCLHVTDNTFCPHILYTHISYDSNCKHRLFTWTPSSVTKKCCAFSGLWFIKH